MVDRRLKLPLCYTSAMRYRMLGIDLDGTLLHSGGEISQANLQAVRRAHDAGVLIVPCTGRGWCESHRALKPLDFVKVGVFVTGAAVCQIESGESLDLAMLEPHLAYRLVESLRDLPEAVLVYRDRWMTGHDYLVTGNGQLTGNTRWWFDHIDAAVHEQPHVTTEDLHDSLRVGMVATRRRMEEIMPHLKSAFAEEILVHHFCGVQMPDPEESVHVLEAFAAGVDKWRGLQWVAAENNIADDEIAVIGDEINDISMLSKAGCGIAMGNAIDVAKQAARYETKPNDEDGVALAIDRLMSGAWE